MWIKQNETIEQFIDRLLINKHEYGLSNYKIADIVFKETNFKRGEKWYRTRLQELLVSEKVLDVSAYTTHTIDDTINDVSDESQPLDEYTKLRKERIKFYDARRAYNRAVALDARDESLKEILEKEISNLSLSKPFLNNCKQDTEISEYQGTLCLSDWHYGLTVQNHFNTYNPQVAISRINNLIKQTIKYIDKFNVKHLNIVNIGDMISGNIHNTIRVENAVNVITQITTISEIIAELLNILSKYVEISYYSCIDNHSRVNSNKDDSIDDESLAHIIPWYLTARLKDNKKITIKHNEIGSDIITFKVFDHNVCAYHGDKDAKDIKDLNKIKTFLQDHYDLHLCAHLHHFSADEDNECMIFRNGSLVGTDRYAYNLRKNTKPSQNLILSTAENVTEVIIKINV